MYIWLKLVRNLYMLICGFCNVFFFSIFIVNSMCGILDILFVEVDFLFFDCWGDFVFDVNKVDYCVCDFN